MDIRPLPTHLLKQNQNCSHPTNAVWTSILLTHQASKFERKLSWPQVFLILRPNSIRAYEGDSPVLSEGKGVGKRLTELYIPNPSPNQMALESAFFWSPFEYTGFLWINVLQDDVRQYDSITSAIVGAGLRGGPVHVPFCCWLRNFTYVYFSHLFL